MRAHLSGNAEATNFSNLLLQIGNGTFPVAEYPDTIKIPSDLGKFPDNLEDLKAKVFPDLAQNRTPGWLSERAILSPLNENVNRLNGWLMEEFPGQEKIYMSVDTTLSDDDAVQYPTELLNSLELSGMPPHVLKLKPGAPIIILRSLEPPKITNGTRCVVIRLHNNVIEATISCGPYIGEMVLLPRIPLISNESDLPFQFRRLQFPLKVAFSLTINKSQGQTFKVMGVDLTHPCFTHGMFYVAASRTGNAEKLFFLAPKYQTRNVVYPEALQ
jgi:ATP-dependent DNA helicase PIF1